MSNEHYLRESKVFRGGATANRLSRESTDIRVSGFQTRFDEERALHLWLSLNSKGGGTTDVRIDVAPADFGKLLRQMSETDRQIAMAAMVAELSYQIGQQPDMDAHVLDLERRRAQFEGSAKAAGVPS